VYQPTHRDATIQTTWTLPPPEEIHVAGGGVRPYWKWKTEIPATLYRQALAKLSRWDETRLRLFAYLLRDESFRQQLHWYLLIAGEDSTSAYSPLAHVESFIVQSISQLMRDEALERTGYSPIQFSVLAKAYATGRLLIPEAVESKAFSLPANIFQLRGLTKKQRDKDLIDLLLIYLGIYDA